MSIADDTIGGRLRYVRGRAGYTQRVMAEKLCIGERTYKFYELGHRDLPVPVALNVCSMFAVDIGWLLSGSQPQNYAAILALAADCVEAVLTINADRALCLPPRKLAILGSLVLEDTVRHGTNAMSNAEKYFKVLE
jgi:DNA-binding XRE family transcriptional regulator